MPVTFQQHTLPNGLRILGEIDQDSHSAAAGFFVDTGARDEDASIMGVSHYLEHMMFKGTDTISAEDINRRFDAMGARNNAYTTSESTCFHAQVLPEHFQEATSLLAHMLRPALRQTDFDLEKNVILEEIAMYKDNPFWVLYEETVARHFGQHPLGHRVLGTAQTVAALTSEQMLTYFTQRYSSDNTVVSLAGRVDFDRACALIERETATWKPTGTKRTNGTPQASTDNFTICNERVNRGYLIAVSPAPEFADERRYAAGMLMQVLGGSDNARLHWALIETGIAEEAQAAYDPHHGVGDSFIYASGEPDRLDKILAVIDQELETLADSITEPDLERIRARMATAATLGGERPNDRMQRVGRQWLAHNAYRSLEDELERIRSVKVEDLREVAAAFPLSLRTLGRLIPA